MPITPPSDETSERAPWLFFSFDDAGKILDVNEAVSRLAGASAEALRGRPVGTLLTKAGQLFYQTHFFPLLQLGERVNEVFLLLANSQGEALPVLAYGVRWESGAGGVNECHCAPIPQRRQFERELIKARKEAEALIRENIALNETRKTLEEQQQQLDRRIRQLERANDELQQIARVVSHDLQEPVRKISVLIDYFNSNPNPDAPERKPLLEQIDTMCRATSRLITGLRDYIALDSDDLIFAPVELDTLVRRAATGAGYANLLTDDWLLASKLPFIQGHEQQLEQLFFQLFDNALKYRSPARPLRVQLTADVIKENKYVAIEGKYHYTDHVRIRIRDNGVGFLPRYNNDVFLLLKRLNKTSPTLGLGLAISKKIVDNHYGTIAAESSPGEGTTITMVLPI